MKPRLIAVVIFGVGIAAGGALFARLSSPTLQKPEIRASRGDESPALGAMRGELRAQRTQEELRLRALEQELSALKGSVERKAAAPEREPSDLSPEERLAELEKNEAARREREAGKQRILQATFQSAFDAEPVDSAWSRGKSSQLRDALSTTAPGADHAPFTLTGLDCRTSLCRAEVKLEGVHAREALEAALDNSAFGGGSYFHPGASPNSTVVYAFREDRRSDVDRIFKSANAAAAEPALTAAHPQ